MRNIALFIVVFCVHACLFAQNKAATYMVRDSLTQVAVRSCRVMFDNKTTEHTTVTDDLWGRQLSPSRTWLTSQNK